MKTDSNYTEKDRQWNNAITVKRATLLLIAGIVWAIVGINILRIGLVTYPPYIGIFQIVLSALVFVAFMMMFRKIVTKHTARILHMEDDLIPVWHFFDKKSYLLMLFMMGLGIALRSMRIAPDIFIAVFYTGLGSALTLAGIMFIRAYHVNK